MSLLRIRCPLRDSPLRCEWALIGDGREPVPGEGPIAQLPRRAERVQLVVPADQVLITRARLPRTARRRSGSILAYAIEDETAGEPESNQVAWLGSAGDDDVLSVVDREGLKRWLDALDNAGLRAHEVHCETLLLPWATGEWSLAWNGRDGYVRTGEREGAATDCGDRALPPLSLRLLIQEAHARGAGPAKVALYTTAPDALPDIAAWQRELGIPLRPAGAWDWRTAPPEAGASLMQQRQRWLRLAGLLPRLRPAAWVAIAALVIHAVALVSDWLLVASERRELAQRMETRFRSAFPDAVAVVDPALQMRRKLAEARHAAGLADSGDFLPMIEKVAAGLKELPPRSLRTVSYENGRMTLELSANEEAAASRLAARLIQSGLSVERNAPASSAAPSPGGRSVILTVRSS